jgi:hypothetical protein
MLTDPQKLIIKTYVEQDPTLSLLTPSADSADTIAKALNLTASPAWIVWRSSVTRAEILQNGFDWTRLDNLSVGKARVWSDIFVDGTINPSKANVRVGLESVWVGTAQDLAVRAAVYVHCKRSATITEKLLSTGTGSDASPATMGYEGDLNLYEVGSALGWSF